MPPTKSATLTARETDLVLAVDRLTRERGFAPSLREIGDAIGVHQSRAARIAAAVRAKGYLHHAPRVARSLRVVPREATP